MLFAAILAGGTGSRMGNQDKPKQYLYLGGKPILAHTVEKFIMMPDFDDIIVLCPRTWIQSTKDLLEREFGHENRLHVIGGGQNRNQTILNAIRYIEEQYGIDEKTVLMTHDAVRPFVSYRIIKDNIAAMESDVACNTVIAATDTIVESNNGFSIASVPDRRRFYIGQTPQTFHVQAFDELYRSLSQDEKNILTDACKVFTLRGYDVTMVEGEPHNIKITFPSDLKMAAALLGTE